MPQYIIKHWKQVFAAAIIVIITLVAVDKASQPQRIHKQFAPILGTMMNIAIIDDGTLKREADAIISEAAAKVKDLEEKMSVFIEESEISRFNQLAAGEEMALSPESWYVIAEAIRYNKLSDGAFDITVLPLIHLYKFNRKEERLPSEEDIKATLAKIGSGNIILEKNGFYVGKKVSGLQLGLGGIAKGYAVDLAMESLLDNGVKNGFVEIGGEIRVEGLTETGEKWNVAVTNPLADTHPEKPYLEKMPLTGCAVATSGNYQQYFVHNGKRYSHIINPKTGYPLEGNIAGVTVIAPTCLQADAIATSICVMGKDKYKDFIDLFDKTRAIIQIEKNDGNIEIINYPY